MSNRKGKTDKVELVETHRHRAVEAGAISRAGNGRLRPARPARKDPHRTGATVKQPSTPYGGKDFDAEMALAGIADVLNQEIRENGSHDDQVPNIHADMRPFIRRLVDYVRQKKSTWQVIVEKNESKIGRKYRDRSGEYTFFGIVHADDDYYYGLIGRDGHLVLSSCVGSLESCYEEVPA